MTSGVTLLLYSPSFLSSTHHAQSYFLCPCSHIHTRISGLVHLPTLSLVLLAFPFLNVTRFEWRALVDSS